MRKPARVLGYARVSSAEQALGTSLQDQQNVIRAYAQKCGLDVTRMYVEAESAVYEKIERREQMLALLRDAGSGDLVLVDKIDRWSRDPAFTHTSVRDLLAKGVSFYAVGDDCDPSTDAGDSMLGMRAFMAREEHKRIRVRLVGTRKAIRDRGYYVEGPRPFGYRRQNDKRGLDMHALVVVEPEAERVRAYFRMSIEGMALSAIASATGDKVARIHKALKNRVYLGEVENSAGQWIKGHHPAIIDARTFARAQESIERRRLGRPCRDTERAETRDWWLRDVARCACGAKLSAAYGPRGQARRYYFRCFVNCTKRYVNVRDAELVCSPLVVDRLEELRELIDGTGGESRQQRAVPQLDELLGRLQKKRARILTQHANGYISDDDLRAEMTKLDAERTKLEAAHVAPPAISKAQRKLAIKMLGTLSRAWRGADGTERRAIVNTLARAVVLSTGEAPARRPAPVVARFDWYSAEELAERS